MESNMKYVIDRIEEDIAVLQDLKSKEMLNINIKELPTNIKEGSFLIKNKIFKIDKKEEDRRRQELRKRFNKLRRK